MAPRRSTRRSSDLPAALATPPASSSPGNAASSSVNSRPRRNTRLPERYQPEDSARFSAARKALSSSPAPSPNQFVVAEGRGWVTVAEPIPVEEQIETPSQAPRPPRAQRQERPSNRRGRRRPAKTYKGADVVEVQQNVESNDSPLSDPPMDYDLEDTLTEELKEGSEGELPPHPAIRGQNYALENSPHLANLIADRTVTGLMDELEDIDPDFAILQPPPPLPARQEEPTWGPWRRISGGYVPDDDVEVLDMIPDDGPSFPLPSGDAQTVNAELDPRGDAEAAKAANTILPLLEGGYMRMKDRLTNARY